jgi:sterol desaturase/sphingolipid hydroxylase (fatty acid hydroxylase superfamily)
MESTDSLLSIFLKPILAFVTPQEKIYFLYLASSLLIAFYLQSRDTSNAPQQQTTLGSIFPAKIYAHRSARVDYIFFALNSILYAALLGPFATSGVYVSSQVTSLLGMLFTPQILIETSGIAITLFYALIMALLADFGIFLAHYAAHRSRVLWEFHKVHHSAEVLTPITAYRMHPLDDIITLSTIGVLIGTADGVVRFFIAPGVSSYAIAGLSLVTFLFFIAGFHLRHSHIWLSYGPTWSKIFVSPVQHQIHHSKAPRHWNKNYGFTFAFWDYLFGSLYIPKEREQIEFGIGNGEEQEYSSPLRLYFLPFKKALAAARRKEKY